MHGFQNWLFFWRGVPKSACLSILFSWTSWSFLVHTQPINHIPNKESTCLVMEPSRCSSAVRTDRLPARENQGCKSSWKTRSRDPEESPCDWKPKGYLLGILFSHWLWGLSRWRENTIRGLCVPWLDEAGPHDGWQYWVECSSHPNTYLAKRWQAKLAPDSPGIGYIPRTELRACSHTHSPWGHTSVFRLCNLKLSSGSHFFLKYLFSL